MCNFKLHASLGSSVMKFHTVLSHSVQDVNPPVVQCVHSVDATPPSHFVALLVSGWSVEVLQCLCSSNSYFTQCHIPIILLQYILTLLIFY